MQYVGEKKVSMIFLLLAIAISYFQTLLHKQTEMIAIFVELLPQQQQKYYKYLPFRDWYNVFCTTDVLKFTEGQNL